MDQFCSNKCGNCNKEFTRSNLLSNSYFKNKKSIYVCNECDIELKRKEKTEDMDWIFGEG